MLGSARRRTTWSRYCSTELLSCRHRNGWQTNATIFSTSAELLVCQRSMRASSPMSSGFRLFSDASKPQGPSHISQRSAAKHILSNTFSRCSRSSIVRAATSIDFLTCLGSWNARSPTTGPLRAFSDPQVIAFPIFDSFFDVSGFGEFTVQRSFDHFAEFRI